MKRKTSFLYTSCGICKENRPLLYIGPAGTCLNQLAEPGGPLQKHKLGKANYYVNQPLYELLARLG